MEKSIKSLNQKEDSVSQINKDDFFFIIDNDLYSLNIIKNEKNDKIIIKAKLENNINKNFGYFENSYSIEELIAKSKPFKLCDTIDEALNIFIDILKAKKAFLNKEIKEKDNKMNNFLLLIIKISLPGGQEQNVEFELYPKKMDKDEYINELIKIIEKLQKENEELKYDNFVKNNEIKLLKNKLVNKSKCENKKNYNNKNRSFDTKRNNLNSKTINSEFNSLFKYGYNDIHNNTDINNIINAHTLYNSNNITLNKIENKDDYINNKSIDNISYFFQSSMSSYKRGRLTKNSDNSNQIIHDFFESRKLAEKENLKENKENNTVKKNFFNKSKSKKKIIELNNVIYIKNDLNKMTMIPIEEYMSIKQIKVKYCAKKFIPIKGKELYYKGIKLNDDKNLEFYNIPWESTLYVLNIPEKINVYVRCLSGKEFKIIVDEFETILKIKFKIYEYENIPIDKQIVLINKKILDDEKTIGQFNIKGDVHLLVRRKEEY